MCLLLTCAVLAGAQVRPMALAQARYEVKPGTPALVAATGDTLNFLLNASSRTATAIAGGTANFTVAPNRTGDQVLLAASLRTSPGEYAVSLSATSASGEQRQTVLDVVVSPRQTVPVNATRPPVVLLNGWEAGFVNTCPVSSDSTDTFGNLAQYLLSDGVPAVYFFDNCAEDANQPIEVLAGDLAKFLATVTYDNGDQVQEIDLVAHSLGGLIARAYLAGLQPDDSLVPPVNSLVRKLILIATPNFGSFVAANFANIIPAGSQSAELIPGSSLLWNLATWNQRTDDLQGVDAIAVIGNAGTYVNNTTGASLQNGSDGIVSLTSASLGFVAQKSSVTRIVPYCHVDPGAFTNTNLEPFNCNAAGIANVTSSSHYTGQIVRSFLAGTSDWSSIGSSPANDLYLTQNGGTFFTLVNGAGAYVTDLTQVVWGTLPLQNGGATNTVFYNDFVNGTGDYQVTSQSLGTFDCGSVTASIGYMVPARCKVGTTIISIGPLANTTGRIVTAGGNITIKGALLGALCNGCKVVATPAGSKSGQSLSVSSWTNQSITAKLPAGLTGFVTISVLSSTGSDAITIMISSPATFAITPGTLQFTSSNGAVPAPQSIQIANAGSGTLAWSAAASDAWLSVSPASGTAPSAATVSVDPAGLAAGTYNGTIQITATGATPASVAVTLVVQSGSGGGSGGTITSVINAGSFQPGVAPAAWLSIFGTNLAGSTYTWQASDFVNGQLPTALQGVSVTIDGKPAYVEYVSPTQINVLAPDDTATGSVTVQVTTAGQSSNALTVQEQAFAPGFFTIGGGSYVAAVHADYTLVGPAGLIAGATSTPAKPGEVILLYAAGFGPTNPALPTGQLVTVPAGLANQVQITIGGTNASVAYAGLVQAGLYQFNVTVPALADGNASVVASIGGAQTQSGVSITVQQ